VAVLLIVAHARGSAAQSVTDADTLVLNGKTHQLWGIEAPDTKQVCPDGWPAGRLAKTRLEALIEGRTVVCEEMEPDHYGRATAICRVDGEDLGALMVREGMAWAFASSNSRAYAQQEDAAKAERVGIHGHGCDVPWEWRAQQRR